MQKKMLDLEKLKNLYENCDMTLSEIAKEMNCSISLVKAKVSHLKLTKFSKYSFITEEILKELYLEKGLSMQNIADRLNVSKKVIQERVEKYKFKKELNIDIDRHLLKQYIEEGYSNIKIAKKFGCSTSVINRRIKAYGINKPSRRKYYIDAEELRHLFVDEKKTIREIAKYFGCSSIIIRIRLKENNIYVGEKRKKRLLIDEDKLKEFINKGLTYLEVAKKMNLKVNTIAHVARKLGFKKPLTNIQKATYEELYDLYIVKKMSLREIGEIYNCAYSTVRNRLKKLQIKKDIRKIYNIIDKDLIHFYIEEGLNRRKTSRKLGVPERLVAKRIKELNIEKYNPNPTIPNNVLKKLYVDDGLNVPEIAKKLKVEQSLVSSRVYKLNLTALRTPEEHRISVNRSYQNSTMRSRGEEEICKLFPTEHLNTHDVLGWELDLWYPEKGVAVEYNGDYWHSSAIEKSIPKHLVKCNLCEQKGIHLINIFERFWRNEDIKPKIINILNNFISKEKLKRVDGEIKEVSKQEEQEFIRKFNIEKVISSDIAIGTFNKDGFLLNMISLNTKTPDFKITRFTTRVGYVEDYKKLIKYIKDNMNCRSIEVSCDRRYYHGELFKELGFEFVKNTKSDFDYCYGENAISRKSYNKNPEKYKSYTKVYDCGRMKLRLTL